MAVENEKEFQDWLKTQPQEMCVLIAARAAVRVFPILSNPREITEYTETLALLAARNILTSGVASKIPTPEVRVAARAAAEPATAAVETAGDAYVAYVARNAASAARAAANAGYASDPVAADASHCAVHTARVVSFATYVSPIVGDVARGGTDAAANKDRNLNFDDLTESAIWHYPTEPDWLIEALAGRPNLLESGPDWAFWHDWYQGWLTGNHLDWELQRRVALIDNAIWEDGPKAVAAEIERIKAEYLADKAPQAERIEFNEETGKFFAVPLDVAKPDLLGATLTQVQDALDDVLANSSNGLRDTSRETRVLNRVFTRYANDPQQIEIGFVSAYKGLARQILNEELPESEENLALQDALQDGARGIRATHPEVAENRKILTEQAIREMRPEDIELIEDARPVLAANSDENLADDWNTDIPQLINDATTPLPNGAPPLPGADEATRIFSRVSKMRLLYDKISEKGAAKFDSKPVKTARFGLLIGELLSALVRLGLRLFGI